MKAWPLLLPPPPPPPPLPQPFTFPSPPKDSISPSILLIIVILAVIFFISGLLHLLVRYLMRPIARDPDEISATAMEGQLQQLFHLHDAGVDQTFIDALPVFFYKAITGLKDPFDCAVCLCEFAGDDKLRLLPKCSHAFHLDCIDRWLLSHSTCPLCRTGLLSDFTSNCSPPLWFALQSTAASESSREISLAPEDENALAYTDMVAVRLGKIKNMDVGSSDGKLDGRRCHSMGSYEYVMDEGSLQVAIKQCKATKKVAMSEYDCRSRRGFGTRVELPDARITGRKESFSVSKIWMRPRRSATATATATESSRRAVSFRLPLQRQASAGLEKSGSEVDLDVEMGSCNESVVSEAPSLSRRTLLWIMGRQSKVGSFV